MRGLRLVNEGLRTSFVLETHPERRVLALAALADLGATLLGAWVVREPAIADMYRDN